MSCLYCKKAKKENSLCDQIWSSFQACLILLQTSFGPFKDKKRMGRLRRELLNAVENQLGLASCDEDLGNDTIEGKTDHLGKHHGNPDVEHCGTVHNELIVKPVPELSVEKDSQQSVRKSTISIGHGFPDVKFKLQVKMLLVLSIRDYINC